MDEHDRCGQGFAIEDAPDDGRVSVRCKGCGATFQHGVHDNAHPPIGLDDRVSTQPAVAPASHRPDPTGVDVEAGLPEAGPPGAAGEASSSMARGGRLGSVWRSRWTTAVLVAIAIAAGTLAILRVTGTIGSGASVPTEVPREPEAQDGGTGGSGAPAQHGGDRAPAQHEERGPRAEALMPARWKIVEGAGFAIRRPPGWTVERRTRSFALLAPEGGAAIRILRFAPNLTLAEMTTLTRRLLARRNRTARIVPAPGKSRALIARAAGSSEVALIMRDSPVSFLLLRKRSAGTSDRVGLEARLAARSFRPT
jgi:hypothetical protein